MTPGAAYAAFPIATPEPGIIGAQLSCALRNEFHPGEDIMREGPTCRPMWWSTPMTLPSRDYGAFGASGDESGARAQAKATGYQVRETWLGWRRVVPSPVPQDIVELETVRDLWKTAAGDRAAGGGGIPVTVRDGVHTAVDAIVDKDSRARSSPGACGPIPRHPDGGGQAH